MSATKIAKLHINISGGTGIGASLCTTLYYFSALTYLEVPGLILGLGMPVVKSWY